MTGTDSELVLDARATIGESPVWSAREGALSWIDVKAPALHRLEHATGATRSWTLPSNVGGHALRADGSSAVLGLRSGVFALDFASGGLERLAEPPFDPATHRFDESGVDPAGRLWLGTMFDPEPGVEADPAPGPLCSYAPGEGLVARPWHALTANGFAWSSDGATFHSACTAEGRIHVAPFDARAGRIGEPRVFAEIDPEDGQPDSGAIDADGFCWSALHRGGRLRRHAPDGRTDREVGVPVANPTMMAFAGPRLDVLYVTNATRGEASGAPHEGGLLRLEPGVRGRLLPLLTAWVGRAARAPRRFPGPRSGRGGRRGGAAAWSRRRR